MHNVTSDIQIPFAEYDLDNGLHVILSPSHAVPIVAVNLWYHVGSKDEDPSRTGFAHLFEHLMFQGSRNVRKAEHFRYVQNAGGTLNATTNADRTNYYESLPSSQLELALWLESDRMLSLDISEENFENQRAVVKEERKQRYDNQPYGLVYERLIKMIYPTGGYRWSTIGSMEHLDAAVLPEVQAFHAKYYHPGNASLAIIGDFESAAASTLIERYFGGIEGKGKVERPVQIIEEPRELQREILYDNVKLPAVYFAFQSAGAFSGDEAALDLLGSVMGSGKSSRLYRELVYERKLAKEIYGFHYSHEKSGIFGVGAILQTGADIAEVEALLWAEIERVRTSGITQLELDKVKNQSEAGQVRSLVELAHRADHLQRAYTFTGSTKRANEELAELLAVTREDVLRVAERYLRKSSAGVLHILPKV